MKNIKIVQIHAGLKENSVPARITRALMKIEIPSIVLVGESELKENWVIKIKESIGYKVLRKMDYLLHKSVSKKQYQINENIPFSYYRVGMPIYRARELKEADVIILHWVCGYYLSVRGIKKILDLKKPVIMVCHDNWHFTGGCHVRMGCEKYMDHCNHCAQLNSKKERDWSYKLFEAKKRVFQKQNITVISPSRWMDENVAKSRLLQKYPHYVIPNPIDTDKYRPIDRMAAREKYGVSKESIVLSFGAVKAVNTPYKGYRQLLEALDIMEKNYSFERMIEVLVFGADSGENREGKKIKMKYMGVLNESEMIDMYNMTDVYVIPSLEDSFNSTVIESMACETPVVSFATGGIVDIIEHKKNGYLAEYNNSESLAEGIMWVMSHNENNVLGRNGRERVLEKFRSEVVADKYLKVIEDITRSMLGERKG